MSINNNSCDLLIHENENGGQHSRSDGSRNGPPSICERMNQPSTTTPRRFKLAGYHQFGCLDASKSVQWSHRANGQENSEIADDCPNLNKKKHYINKFLITDQC